MKGISFVKRRFTDARTGYSLIAMFVGSFTLTLLIWGFFLPWLRTIPVFQEWIDLVFVTPIHTYLIVGTFLGMLCAVVGWQYRKKQYPIDNILAFKHSPYWRDIVKAQIAMAKGMMCIATWLGHEEAKGVFETGLNLLSRLEFVEDVQR